jgi:TonB family protein
MIKTCPICNRTYSDETISFCLADGALLSAPYDQSGPPTEVLPASLAPTQRATQPTPMPTITAPPPKSHRVTRADSAAPASGGVKRLVLAAAVVIVLALLSMIGYKILTRKLGQEEAVAANPNSVNGVLTTPGDSPRETAKLSPAPSTSPAAANKERERMTPTPLTKVPDKPSVSTPTPAAADTPKTPPVDYNKVFSGKEVTQRARILSQPRAGYTDTARQNGISGTVTLRMVLAASGEVTKITVVSGLPDGLSEKAVAAARQIKFEPAMKDGRAVSQYIQVQYNFSLY